MGPGLGGSVNLTMPLTAWLGVSRRARRRRPAGSARRRHLSRVGGTHPPRTRRPLVRHPDRPRRPSCRQCLARRRTGPLTKRPAGTVPIHPTRSGTGRGRLKRRTGSTTAAAATSTRSPATDPAACSGRSSGSEIGPEHSRAAVGPRLPATMTTRSRTTKGAQPANVTWPACADVTIKPSKRPAGTSPNPSQARSLDHAKTAGNATRPDPARTQPDGPGSSCATACRAPLSEKDMGSTSGLWRVTYQARSLAALVIVTGLASCAAPRSSHVGASAPSVIAAATRNERPVGWRG